MIIFIIQYILSRTGWSKRSPRSRFQYLHGISHVDGKRLTNVGAPTGDDDATTKKYVPDQVSSTVDLTPYLKKDGSVP